MVNFTGIVLLMILMIWTNGSTGAAFSIEEELLQLKIQMKEIIKSLEINDAKMKEKLTELESKNVKMQEEITEMKLKDVEMEEKVAELEAKNVQLGNKVQEQENILAFLLSETELPTSSTGSKSILNNFETAIESTGRSGTLRTCRELRAADPSLSSGMHWIDPDGQGVGDDPIYVYCDMKSGSTSILHDTETPIDVGHCADPGCYSRAINYNASMGQIKSLIALSSECHQQIKYDCYYAPFEFDKVPYAWWNDRNGNAQYFWAGNNTDGIHTCQCGLGGNCVDSSVKCNCDVIAPVQLVDDGVITEKNVLPVTRLNFGRTQLAISSGIPTLGRFECTGTVALAGLPTSCEDLWLIGHTLSGLYLVMEGDLVKNIYCDFTKWSSETGFQSLIGYAEVKPKPTYFGMPTSCANLKGAGHTSSGFYYVKGSAMMESVYCDFTKLPSDSGLQKWIGYVDVKSAPVHFYVQRSSSFSTINTPIPFNLARVNEGNAMNLATGKFTAPRNGIYFFSFTGMASFPPSTSLVYLIVHLYLNGVKIGRGEVSESNNVYQFSPLTLQSTLNMKKGDQIWVEIPNISSGVFLYDHSNEYWTHFTGFLLEEEIVSSLL